MGTFGEGVASLLDTYTRCLTLLKGLSRGSESNKQQEKLGDSIRFSRSRVRNYYSSKASESGSSFEKGDATACNSLRRLVRRLRAFVDDIIRILGGKNRTVIDYESLMALSQGSGLEAIRTMADLSERVSIKSASSHASHETHGRQKPSKGKSNMGSRSSSTSTRSSNTPKNRSKLSTTPTMTWKPAPGRSAEKQAHTKADRRGSSRHLGKGSVDSLGRRRSMLTTSSDSTKLGEIRHGESLRQARATYPLWTYPREPTKLKKGKLFGLFAR